MVSQWYNIRTQSKIPGAIAALHNFIHIYDPDDLATEEGDNSDDDDDEPEAPNRYDIPIIPENLGGHISQVEKDRAGEKRDGIAKAMWEDYVEELRNRGMI